jgi:plasmid stability protein
MVSMNLTLKNVPDDVCHKLKKSAAEHRRSLNAEIVTVLTREAEEHDRRQKRKAWRTELKRFADSLPEMSSSVSLLREDRDRG